MTGLQSLLARHGSGLVLALSCLLGVGALAVLLGRSPLHRQRVAELTLAAALLACGLLLLPLPRPGLGWLADGGDDPVPASVEVASALTTLSLPITREIPLTQPVPRTARGTSDLRRESVFPGAPRLLAQLFLLGAAGFAAHLLLSFALLRRTLGKAGEAPAWVTRLASGSQPEGSPRVLLAQGAARPFCCGLGRGTIVLPAHLAQPALKTRVEAVLAHERAHLAQRHPRARLLAALVAPFLYWHPLYWWLVRELRRCSELLADDMAAGRLDKRQYVAELLELAESCSRAPASQALGLGAFGSRKIFLERMETLLMRRTRLSTHSSVFHVATRSLCAALLLGSVSLAWGRPPQDGLPGRHVERDLTKPAPHSYGPLPTLQDYTLETSATVPLPEDQPGLVATLSFVDPRALGEFFVQCYDAGLAVRIIELGAPDPMSGRRTGRASVHGVHAGSLNFLMEFEVPGLDLILLTVTNKQLPAPTPPANPLARRVDRMQQELADLQAQIAQLEALRADFRGRAVDYTETVDPAGLPKAKDSLLLVDPRTALPPSIQGVVVNMLGEDQNLVAIKRGTDHGVAVGQVFEIYRGSAYKGRVRIVSVGEGLSVGTIELQVEGQRIKKGDKATTRL